MVQLELRGRCGAFWRVIVGDDGSTEPRFRRHAAIGLRGVERIAPHEMRAVQPEGYRNQTLHRLGGSASVCGFTAMDVGCNAGRIERTYRDTRLDSVDHYFAIFPVAGQSAMIHNDQAVQLVVGDVAFVDAARPGTFFRDNGSDAWNTVKLEFAAPVPCVRSWIRAQAGLHRRGGTSAGRLLFNLIRDADQAEGSVLSLVDS